MKKLSCLLICAVLASPLISPSTATASAPPEQKTLIVCTSLKTGFQIISKTGKCDERVYERRTWYQKGSAPTGTPGSGQLDLRTCISKSSSVHVIRTRSACNSKTQTTSLWQRPLGPPVAPSITSVVMGVLGTATLEISAPNEDGGARVTSYLVTSAPGEFKATYKPDQIKAAKFSGLIPGDTYSFSVVAINSKGSSPASISSKPTIAPTIPSPPTITTVVATGTNSAQLIFTAPTNDGGSPITSYVVRSNPGGLQTIVYQSASGTINISNLTHSTNYTFTLIANNNAGASPESAHSTSVTTSTPPPPAPVAEASTPTPTPTPTLAAPAFTLSSSSESRTVNTVATGFTINSTGGDIASFAISPAAPAGMNFNLTTGAFTGTPTSVASVANYTITATNATGSTSQTFAFTVILAAQAGLNITTLTTNTKAYPYSQALSMATSGGSVSAAPTFAIASGGTASGCTLSNSTSTATITATTAGTCLIEASKAADSTYSATTSPTVTFTFTTATQTITFATPSAMTLGGSTQTVAPTTSSSLTVTLTSTTTGVCTVAGFVITAVATGTCSITASQPGDGNFSAAANVIQSFAISGPATAAAITTQPAGAGSGSVLGTQPIIRIVDSGGNTVTTSTVNVVASIASGTGTLSGTTTIAASSGIATFTNLVVTGTAGAFTLTFTPTSLTAVTSNSLTITAGPASKVAITRASVGTERRTAFTTQPQITIRDTSNNTVTLSTEVVTATITSGVGGSLVGTATATASSGLATFTGLGVDGTIGTTYTITYTVTGLTVATATVTLTGTTCYGIFTCQVGDTGPGGGKIFYVESGTFTQVGATGSMCTTNCKYLEAAPTTGVNAWTDAAYVWSGNTTQAIGANARRTAIGTGYANTLAIVGQSSGGDTPNRAGTISRAYRGPNNQSDWYLPSKSEIEKLIDVKTIVGGIVNSAYWSSSERDTVGVNGDTRAWAHGDGPFTPEKKDNYYVRPIRAFALPTTIATAAIAGVTAPVTGATPVTTTTSGTGYTGTVSWASSSGALVGNFAGATAYTATITLTPTTGYTVTGVNANFFTVAGATSVTHLANSGVITAVFPQTVITIATAAIAGVTAPVTGATPVTTTTAGTGYTGTVSWSESPSTFASVTIYTATITLTPTSGYTLTGVSANFFTVAGATSVTHSANSGVITVEFPRTLGYCDGSTFTCQVGDTGPGGGKIFYVASTTFTQVGATGSMCTTNCKYLEAAPSTWFSGAGDPRISWSTDTDPTPEGYGNQRVAVLDARETAIGSGYKNSLAIVAQTGNVTATSAAVAAREYTGGSKTDWYLPSKDELYELYINRVAAGATGGYWSSSEVNEGSAWDQGFSDGSQGFADYAPPARPGKGQTTPVRPIRAFGP